MHIILKKLTKKESRMAQMIVEIEHTEDYNFLAKTSKSSFEVRPKEISPLEYFCVGLISCSGYDIVAIPKKQGYEVKNLKLKAEIIRRDNTPYKFDAFHLIYSFDSTAEPITARRWVLASLETYCTTINTVRDSAKVLYTIIYNGQKIADKDEILSGKEFSDFVFDQNALSQASCAS